MILIIFSSLLNSENCTWDETKWGEWSSCKTIDDCGGGYRQREREHCICGNYNGTQNNKTMCGISPIHIEKCHVICEGIYHDHKLFKIYFWHVFRILFTMQNRYPLLWIKLCCDLVYDRISRKPSKSCSTELF